MSVAAVIQAIFRHPTVTDGAADSNRRGNSFIPGNKTDKIWRPWGSGLFSIDDIRDWVIRRSTEFQLHLLAILYDHSLSTSSGLSFQINRGQNISLVSSHDSRDIIEGLINDSQLLQQLFFDISATASFLRSVDENPNFRDLYSRNPELAVARYGQLHAQRSQYEFRLSVTTDGITFGFATKVD